jgi:hypothetical protein
LLIFSQEYEGDVIVSAAYDAFMKQALKDVDVGFLQALAVGLANVRVSRLSSLSNLAYK